MDTSVALGISPRKRAKAEAILDAAEGLIIETGGDFEISQLAATANVSNGLAYHYFGSKDGVIEAVIDRFYGRYTAVMDQPADTRIAWPVRERARLEDTIAFLYSDPLAKTVFSRLSHPRALHKEFEMQRAMMEKAARNVRSGQTRGQIPPEIDSALAGAAIIGAVRATMAMAMQLKPRPSPRRMAEQIWGFIEGVVGLRPE